MKADHPVHKEDYRGRSYAVHCEPSELRPGKWLVWVEVFAGAAERGDLLLSAEHEYTFTSYENGLEGGRKLAEQLIDAQD